MKNPIRMVIVWMAVLVICIGVTACDDDGTKNAEEAGELLDAALANRGNWAWVELDDMNCRDGSTTGVAVKLAEEESDELMLFFMGGGACFNSATCFTNPSSYDEEDYSDQFESGEPAGIFDATNADNPLANANVIFIPYCTGDVHGGSNPSGDPTILIDNQVMTGYENTTAVLDNLGAYFQETEPTSKVLVTGSSAGGFGTLPNFPQIADRFSSIAEVHMVNYSGPVFLNDLYTTCLYQSQNTPWQIVYPSDYESAVTGSYNLEVQGIYEYIATQYPASRLGLISSYEDSTIRFFYSFGQLDCEWSALDNEPIAGDVFQEALEDIRDSTLNTYDNWSTYYFNGESHTVMGDDELFYDYTVNGTSIATWLSELWNESTPDDIAE